MKQDLLTLSIYGDGGSRGNPGEAAYGYLIVNADSKELVHKEGKRIGIATNNTAEYMAVLSALTWITENITQPIQSIDIFVDSQLVARQLAGIYRIKNRDLLVLVQKIKLLERNLKASFTFTHIPREQNKDADRLVNLALDNKV